MQGVRHCIKRVTQGVAHEKHEKLNSIATPISIVISAGTISAGTVSAGTIPVGTTDYAVLLWGGRGGMVRGSYVPHPRVHLICGYISAVNGVCSMSHHHLCFFNEREATCDTTGCSLAVLGSWFWRVLLGHDSRLWTPQLRVHYPRHLIRGYNIRGYNISMIFHFTTDFTALFPVKGGYCHIGIETP